MNPRPSLQSKWTESARTNRIGFHMINNSTLRAANFFVALLATLVIFYSNAFANDGETKVIVAKALDAYYSDQKNIPDDNKFLDDLISKDPTRVASAQGFFLELLQRLLDDEMSGRAPVNATPFWGGSGSKSSARVLRGEIAQHIKKLPRSAESVPIISWIINRESDEKTVAEGWTMLKETTAPEADRLIEGMLQGVAPFQEKNLLLLIEQAADRRLSVNAKLLEFINHHREPIRNAARAALARLGEKNVRGFDPEKSRDLTLAAFIHLLDELFIYSPSDLKELLLATRKTTWLKETRESKFHLWRLQDGSRITIFGEKYLGFASGLPQGSSETEAVLSVDDFARSMIEARNAPKANFFDQQENLLSRMGGLTGQFESGGISTSEALLAAFLAVNNKKKLAYEILEPALNSSESDDVARLQLQQKFGHIYHQAMLGSFVAKDYQTAILYADHLSRSVFDSYSYQERAKEMAAQLRQRGSDFKSLTLPTEAEWAKLKQEKTKPQLIRYLCERLRLLRGAQYSQPGSVSFDIDPDRANARAAAAAAARQGKPTPTPVDEGSRSIKVLKTFEETATEVGDIPELLPFLDDTNYVLAYGYWRDFHPGRSLFRVNGFIGSRINMIAKTNLVNADQYAMMSAEEKESVRNKILAWTKAHEGASASTLQLESAKNTKEERVYLAAMKALIDAKDERVLEVIPRTKEFPSWAQKQIGEQLVDSKMASFEQAGVTALLQTIERTDRGWPAKDAILKLAALKNDEVIPAFKRLIDDKALSSSLSQILVAIFTMDTKASRAFAWELLENNPSLSFPGSYSDVQPWVKSEILNFWPALALLQGDEPQRKKALVALETAVEQMDRARYAYASSGLNWNPEVVGGSHIIDQSELDFLFGILQRNDTVVNNLICRMGLTSSRKPGSLSMHDSARTELLQGCLLLGSQRALDAALLNLKDTQRAYSGSSGTMGNTLHYEVLYKDEFAYRMIRWQSVKVEGHDLDNARIGGLAKALGIEIQPPESLNFELRDPDRAAKDAKIEAITAWLIAEYKRFTKK